MASDKQRLLVDMDGVLSNIYAQMIAYEYAANGIEIALEDVHGKDEIVAFPNGLKHVHSPGFFRTAPVIDHAIEVMETLNDSFELFIVSAAMEFPNSLREKYDWLEEHFPFITWQQIILCGHKKAVCGDIMIDDHFKNLDNFNGRTLLFTQPHNVKEDRGHQRVNDWKEVASLLL